MKKNHTDITIVLDRSGSMQSVAHDTIGGFNRFLSDQQNAPGTAAITLHQFDDQFETVMAAQDVKSAPKLTTRTFVPRGNTALLDAIGRSIKDTGARLESTPEHERAERVIFVIVTDGYENASREFTRPKIHEMITHQREKYAWDFVFLGANQDAIAEAKSVGVVAACAMTYASDSEGTQDAFAATASNVVRSRSGGGAQALHYSAAQRAEQNRAREK